MNEEEKLIEALQNYIKWYGNRNYKDELLRLDYQPHKVRNAMIVLETLKEETQTLSNES